MAQPKLRKTSDNTATGTRTVGYEIFDATNPSTVLSSGSVSYPTATHTSEIFRNALNQILEDYKNTQSDVEPTQASIPSTTPTGWVVNLATSESYRTSNLVLSANTYADNVSISLGAGVWLVIADNCVQSPSAAAQRVTVKLWNGTTVYSSSESAAPSQGTSTLGFVNISISKVLTLTSTTTVKTSVASTAASTVLATVADNGTGTTNTANSIRAVRIG